VWYVSVIVALKRVYLIVTFKCVYLIVTLSRVYLIVTLRCVWLWPWGFSLWPWGVSLFGCDLEVCLFVTLRRVSLRPWGESDGDLEMCLFDCDLEASTVMTPCPTRACYDIRGKTYDIGASINFRLPIFPFSDAFVLFPLKNTSKFGLHDKIVDFLFFLNLSVFGKSAILRYCATLFGDECRTSWYGVTFSKRRIKSRT
jgi:hypothetical protein